MRVERERRVHTHVHMTITTDFALRMFWTISISPRRKALWRLSDDFGCPDAHACTCTLCVRTLYMYKGEERCEREIARECLKFDLKLW